MLASFSKKKKKKVSHYTTIYVFNVENHYWILHIQYQFIITVHEILLNTKNK